MIRTNTNENKNVNYLLRKQYDEYWHNIEKKCQWGNVCKLFDVRILVLNTEMQYNN